MSAAAHAPATTILAGYRHHELSSTRSGEHRPAGNERRHVWKRRTSGSVGDMRLKPRRCRAASRPFTNHNSRSTD